MKPIQIAIALLFTVSLAHADPQITSWFTANSGKYARIFTSSANEGTNTSSTTWSKSTYIQANPAYADVNEVNASTNWVYIRATGLASYVMGPWPTNFPSLPTNTATFYRIPRSPTIPTTKTSVGLGATGRMVNGVAMFDSRDAFSYSNANTADAAGNTAFTGEAILKPAVSGAARHTYRLNAANLDAHEAVLLELLREEAMMLQPFRSSLLTQGELSLIVVGGRCTHAVRKIAKAGDFRVQDDHGGTVHPHTPAADEIAFAESAVAACPQAPLYARVDAVRDAAGALSLMELELVEPELFFRFHPPAADALAAAIAERL